MKSHQAAAYGPVPEKWIRVLQLAEGETQTLYEEIAQLPVQMYFDFSFLRVKL
jgi:hypothetical protein